MGEGNGEKEGVKCVNIRSEVRKRWDEVGGKEEMKWRK